MTDGADVAKMPAPAGLQRLSLHRFVVGDYLLSVTPKLPAIRQCVGYCDVNDACLFPVSFPPDRRVNAPHVLSPPRSQMLGKWVAELLHQSGSSNPDRSTRFHEVRDVAEIQIIRAVMEKGVTHQHPTAGSAASSRNARLTPVAPGLGSPARCQRLESVRSGFRRRTIECSFMQRGFRVSDQRPHLISC